MTGIEIDRETTRAVEALAYRIKTRGEDDAEFTAREFMLALRSRGWRPTNARKAPDAHQAGGVTDPEARAALLAEARARFEEATGRQHAEAEANREVAS